MSTWFRSYGYAEILDTLVIGAYPRDVADAAMIIDLGVQRVLNLVDDREYEAGERAAVESAYARAGIEERRISFEDFGNLPPEKLETAVETVLGWMHEGFRCYVHCRAGQQRSAIVATAVVAIEEELELVRALFVVKERKPSTNPLPHQLQDLSAWWQFHRTLPDLPAG